ncbi:hypothetical protein CE143_01505 [Photorhabdus luminescens]|uniref:Uncharacterized protein n=1 Tax=Photorhabdus akhurstii TaxID=171438 RepID=A0ABX8LRQ6_9GAMM|nr:hypothetical protein [Photorhabdus akhurstii]QXF31999.1 hypothetical protein B0X70_01510 [Photorhabdus akhurstii]UJD73791.1 hypothetical protein CE143_01505 [Photorhabdus luminescens]
MKIYGYESEDSDLVSLNEITFQASVDELKELVLFINHSISLIELNGNTFDHEHLSDFIKNKENKENKKPDVIITSMKKQ